MRETPAVLLISDISGYTEFVTNPVIALRHREEIISELIEVMIDEAVYPLTVNKLEGDAMLAYAEFDPSTGEHVAASVLDQARALHRAFAARREAVRVARRNCACDACATVDRLGIKTFLHAGIIAIKQIRQFSEIAGASVILIHRLLKNTVAAREYLLLTADFQALLGEPPADARAHREDAAGIGQIECQLLPA